MDSLVYSEIKNSVKDDQSMGYFSQTLNSDDFDPLSTYNDQYVALDKILADTTIKRACCMEKEEISVRIPIPNSIEADIESGAYDNANIDIMKSLGYFDKKVNVPSYLCKDEYRKGSVECDNFYIVYCKNALENFKKSLNGKKYDHKDFVRYKPECGCYGDISAFGTNIPETFPRKCIFTAGCGIGTQSYLDPASRTQDCSLTVCEAIVSAANANVGGDITIKPEIRQNCNQKNQEENTTKSYGVGGGPISNEQNNQQQTNQQQNNQQQTNQQQNNQQQTNQQQNQQQNNQQQTNQQQTNQQQNNQQTNQQQNNQQQNQQQNNQQQTNQQQSNTPYYLGFGAVGLSFICTLLIIVVVGIAFMLM